MGYTSALREREARTGRPVRVGVVGAGQMGSGLVASIESAPGLGVVAVADIDTSKAERALRDAGRHDVAVLGDNESAAVEAIEQGQCVAMSNGLGIARLPVDIVVEVSGVPELAAQVAYACITQGTHVALMTVEADVTVGPLLANMANANKVVYTVMRGDEPVECLKLIEYAQDLGMDIVCAGKGKNNVNLVHSVPRDNEAEAARKGMNARMLTEFTDGTKTQIEMAALSNATNLPLETAGMYGRKIMQADLATTLIPNADGGILSFDKGPCVEYVTGDVAPGVFVIVKSRSDVVTRALDYLRLGTGPYYAFVRPWHIASIEAHLSIAEAVLYRQADFQSRYCRTEVVGRAKSPLEPGLTLDSLGGRHYYGWAMDAKRARDRNAVPIGLLSRSVVRTAKDTDEVITYDDLLVDETRPLVAMRRLQDALVTQGLLG